MLERGDDVGGTWHYNTYPGCACDVPSHLYSFSFAPNPEWSETYSRQPEIRDYLQPRRRRVRRAREGARSTAPSRASSGTRTRRLDDRDLRRAAARARRGRRHGPAGRAEDPRHRGPRGLRGRDVPLRPLEPRLRPDAASASPSIGTGASAIQFVPEIQTAGRAAARLPAHRAVGHAAPEPRRSAAGRSASTDALPGAAEARARRRLRRPRAARARLRQEPAADEGRRADRPPAHAQPDLRPRAAARRSRPTTRSAASASCRRTRWYRALAKPNVELLTGGVEQGHRATRSSPATARSARSTRSSSAPASRSPTCRSAGWSAGRGGKTLDEAWQGSPKAHLGAAIAGLPEPVRPARAEHRPRPLARWST